MELIDLFILWLLIMVQLERLKSPIDASLKEVMARLKEDRSIMTL